jgi:DNA-binding NarL/FixJ family response regulator
MPRPMPTNSDASREGDAAILLDGSGHIADVNALACGLLSSWFPDWQRGSALPSALSNWVRACAQRPEPATRFIAEQVDLQLQVRRIPLGNMNVLLLSEVPNGSTVQRLHDLGLTPREAEVVLLIADGNTVCQAARRLTISARTVEKHIQLAYEKLGVHNRASAANLVREIQQESTS